MGQGESHRHWIEIAQPVPFTNIPHVIWFLMNDKFTFLFPPYEVRLLNIPWNQPLVTAISAQGVRGPL